MPLLAVKAQAADVDALVLDCVVAVRRLDPGLDTCAAASAASVSVGGQLRNRVRAAGVKCSCAAGVRERTWNVAVSVVALVLHLHGAARPLDYFQILWGG